MGESPLRCHFCKGRLVRARVPYTVHRNGYHLVVDSIPVWVCGQCGETYFEGPEVHQIQEAVKTLGPKAPKIQVRSRNRWTLSDSDAPVDGRMPWLVVLFVLFWVFCARNPSADLHGSQGEW